MIYESVFPQPFKETNGKSIFFLSEFEFLTVSMTLEFFLFLFI